MESKLLAAERARDEAIQEAQLWRAELAKAREQAVVREAALVRAVAFSELKQKAGLERDVEVATVLEATEMSSKSGLNNNNIGEAVISAENKEMQEAVSLNKNEGIVVPPLLDRRGGHEMPDFELVENVAPMDRERIETDSISVPESSIEGIIIKDIIAPDQP